MIFKQLSKYMVIIKKCIDIRKYIKKHKKKGGVAITHQMDY